MPLSLRIGLFKDGPNPRILGRTGRAPDVDVHALAAQMLQRVPRMIGEAGTALEPRLTELRDEATGWQDALGQETVGIGLPDYAPQFRRLAHAVRTAISTALSVPPSRRGPDSYFASKVDVVDEALAVAADALANP